MKSLQIKNKFYLQKELLSIIIGIKIITFLVVIFAFHFLPFGQQYYKANFVYPPNEPISFLSAFKTWDAQHYLYLSEKGYKPGVFSNSFYPLFPAVIKLFHIVIPSSLISSLVINNILSIAAFFLFYQFVKETWGKDIAFTSTLVLLVFPTSFYFALPYSEALFFLLTIGFFYLLTKKKFMYAALIAFFLPLTRPIGISIIFPFLVYVLMQKSYRFLPLVITPILGFLFYLFYMYINTGNFFEGFLAQENSIGKWSLIKLFHPELLYSSLFSFPLAIHGFTNSLLDRMFFVMFLLLCIGMFRKLPLWFALFALPLGLTPVFGSFMSYMRYIVLAFPLFILMGIFLEKKQYSFLKLPLLLFLFSLQMLFLITHSLNYWIG